VALQILLNDTYKLNHCKEMGAKPGRRFLIQPAAKLEFVIVDISLFRKYVAQTLLLKRAVLQLRFPVIHLSNVHVC